MHWKMSILSIYKESWHPRMRRWMTFFKLVTKTAFVNQKVKTYTNSVLSYFEMYNYKIIHLKYFFHASTIFLSSFIKQSPLLKYVTIFHDLQIIVTCSCEPYKTGMLLCKLYKTDNFCIRNEIWIQDPTFLLNLYEKKKSCLLLCTTFY